MTARELVFLAIGACLMLLAAQTVAIIGLKRQSRRLSAGDRRTILPG
jgi:hypothetical protein